MHCHHSVAHKVRNSGDQTLEKLLSARPGVPAGVLGGGGRGAEVSGALPPWASPGPPLLGGLPPPPSRSLLRAGWPLHLPGILPEAPLAHTLSSSLSLNPRLFLPLSHLAWVRASVCPGACLSLVCSLRKVLCWARFVGARRASVGRKGGADALRWVWAPGRMGAWGPGWAAPKPAGGSGDRGPGPKPHTSGAT